MTELGSAREVILAEFGSAIAPVAGRLGLGAFIEDPGGFRRVVDEAVRDGARPMGLLVGLIKHGEHLR